LRKIGFYSKSTDYQVNNKKELQKIVLLTAKMEKVKIDRIDYFFVNRNEILEINKDFLKHSYDTDVISFGENFIDVLKGEIFICIPVLYENSKRFSKGSFNSELLRVIIHGLLHLIGYNDISEDEKEIMRTKENFYLEMFFVKMRDQK
jgi:probable rRNA maturation factor